MLSYQTDEANVTTILFVMVFWVVVSIVLATIFHSKVKGKRKR